MLISGLRIAGIAYPVSEMGATEIHGPQLQASENQIQVDFLGISLAPGVSLRYQYKLEGADHDWSAPTDQRTVNYANLSPGEYRFLVRAISAGGLMSQSPAVVSFRILPPIWRRWWFIALAACCIAASIYAVDRYRIARLIEMERMRTRIATDLHDDIGSSLSQVSVLSEVIRRQVGNNPVVAEPLSMIATLSRDLIDAMNDIVWAINPRRDRLADLSHRMRRFASDVFTARDIAFSFNAPGGQHDIRLDTDVRREVFLVFKEAINNIARHAACTEAAVDFRMDGHWLELHVIDNGKGFDPEQPGDGNGLASMRQRAGKIGGALTIISATDKGAAVKLKAPVRRRRWLRT
jgi:signal transduction histidine kinase